MKYVYLSQSLENSYYKIGISKHPQKRLSENQTGNPSKTQIIHMFKSEFPYLVETAIHRRYEGFRKNGEWFDLSIEVEVNFLSYCRQIEENLEFLRKSGNVFI